MSEREYVFVIKNEDATTEKKETPVAGENNVQRQPSAESNEKAGVSKTAGVAFAAVSTVESFVVPVVNHEINKVELATGSREYSQRVQFGMQVGQSVFDVGKSVAAGAFVGGWYLRSILSSPPSVTSLKTFSHSVMLLCSLITGNSSTKLSLFSVSWKVENLSLRLPNGRQQVL